MKSFSLSPLAPFSIKKLGFIIVLIGVLILFLKSLLSTSDEFFILKKGFDVVIVGLVLISLSREKIEDEGVKLIRYKSLQLFLQMVFIVLTSLHVRNVFWGVESINYNQLAVLIIGYYVLIFHLLKLLNPTIAYNDGDKLKTKELYDFTNIIISVLMLGVGFFSTYLF